MKSNLLTLTVLVGMLVLFLMTLLIPQSSSEFPTLNRWDSQALLYFFQTVGLTTIHQSNWFIFLLAVLLLNLSLIVMDRFPAMWNQMDKRRALEIDFDEVTNDEAMIVATLEYGELLRRKEGAEKLSTPMSVFQMWYFAKAPEFLEASTDKRNKKIIAQASQCFPDLLDFPRFEQLAMGAEFLKKRTNDKEE